LGLEGRGTATLAPLASLQRRQWRPGLPAATGMSGLSQGKTAGGPVLAGALPWPHPAPLSPSSPPAGQATTQPWDAAPQMAVGTSSTTRRSRAATPPAAPAATRTRSSTAWSAAAGAAAAPSAEVENEHGGRDHVAAAGALLQDAPSAGPISGLEGRLEYCAPAPAPRRASLAALCAWRGEWRTAPHLARFRVPCDTPLAQLRLTKSD
jgi:hypothetical protein